MPLETSLMRTLAGDPSLSSETARTLNDAADYIETLRRQLYEAHSHNTDSERLDWLESQARVERSDTSHRSYYALPRICAKKAGESARTLRQAIDDLRRVGVHDD